MNDPLPPDCPHEVAACAIEELCTKLKASGLDAERLAPVIEELRESAKRTREQGRMMLQRGASGATNEQIHDEKISPLMGQIIEIALAHKIPMVASFYLGPGLKCTTLCGVAPSEMPTEFIAAKDLIFDGVAAMLVRRLAMTAPGGDA